MQNLPTGSSPRRDALPRKAAMPAPREPPPESARSATLAAWCVFAASGLFIFYQFILQALPSVIRDGLVVDFSLTDAGFGTLSSSFYYPYMLLQVPCGLLVLRFGSRRLLLAGLGLCVLAALVTALSRDLLHVALARMLMGVGAAPAFVATMALVTRWFPGWIFPLLVALTETVGMLGAALGQEILGFVVQEAGWRAGMLLCAGLGAMLMILIGTVVRDAPDPQEQAPAPAEAARPLAALARMMLAPNLILVGLAGGAIYSAGLSFAMLWGVAFFQKHLAVDLAAASFIASFFSWGIVAGFPLFGWACGRLAGPLPLLIVGAAMTGASVALILYAPPSVPLSCLGMLTCGFFCASYALAFVVAKSELAPADAGAGFAYVNMLVIAVGGLLLQPLIGILAEAQGRPVTEPRALAILVWAQAAGLLLLFWLGRRLRMPPSPHASVGRGDT
jgi:MFS family permease